MNFNNFPPNIDPHNFAFIAVAVGYACVGNFNANEQNSIGNWLILIGQYILTHAAQQQLIESRIENNNININSRKSKNGFGPFTDNENNKSNQTHRNEIDFLIDAVQKIQAELQNININNN